VEAAFQPQTTPQQIESRLVLVNGATSRGRRLLSATILYPLGRLTARPVVARGTRYLTMLCAMSSASCVPAPKGLSVLRRRLVLMGIPSRGLIQYVSSFPMVVVQAIRNALNVPAETVTFS
jgi:hypothetical protein